MEGSHRLLNPEVNSQRPEGACGLRAPPAPCHPSSDFPLPARLVRGTAGSSHPAPQMDRLRPLGRDVAALRCQRGCEQDVCPPRPPPAPVMLTPPSPRLTSHRPSGSPPKAERASQV